MPDSPTPGAVAYAAWWRTRYGMQPADPVSAYQLLPAVDRRAWDAAAQAVLDAARAQRVWDRQAPSSRWQEVPPAAPPADEPAPPGA